MEHAQGGERDRCPSGGSPATCITAFVLTIQLTRTEEGEKREERRGEEGKSKKKEKTKTTTDAENQEGQPAVKSDNPSPNRANDR